MKTIVGISLLVVGLIIGVAASAVFSLGAVVGPSRTTSTNVETVFNTTVVTYTATVQETLPASSTATQSSSPGTPVTNSLVTQSYSSSSASVSTVSSSTSKLNPQSNVTIVGSVSVQNGQPYQVTLTSPSGTNYVIQVQGLGQISASVPNNETYGVVVYYYPLNGVVAYCYPQPLAIYSQLEVYAVQIAC